MPFMGLAHPNLAWEMVGPSRLLTNVLGDQTWLTFQIVVFGNSKFKVSTTEEWRNTLQKSYKSTWQSATSWRSSWIDLKCFSQGAAVLLAGIYRFCHALPQQTWPARFSWVGSCRAGASGGWTREATFVGPTVGSLPGDSKPVEGK